jgi:hypothetical protein
MLTKGDAVVIDGGRVIGFKDGKSVDEHGNAVSDKVGIRKKVVDWMVPDKNLVSDDYGKFQKWQFIAHAADDAIGYVAVTATAAGLAAGLHIPYLAFLGAGTGVLVARTAFDFVGQMVGNNKGKSIDDDPAKWTARSNIVTSAAQAAQCLVLAAPSAAAYFALVPATNAVAAFGDQTDALGQQLISNHQAKTGAVGYVAGKNKNQNLVSGAIGSAIGIGASVALGALIGPWAPLLAVPAFFGIAWLASQRKGAALKLDNLTNSSVRGLAHEDVTKNGIPTPDELKADKANRKDLTHQARIMLGANATDFAKDKERLADLAEVFGSNKFLMDVGEKHGIKGKKPVINVAMGLDSEDKDLVHAEYTAQILSDILESPGYKQLEAKLNDPKATSLQAMKVAVGYTSNFDQTYAALPEHGWSLDRTVLGGGTDKLGWHQVADAPILAVDHNALQAFMQTGEVPTATVAPAPPAAKSEQP